MKRVPINDQLLAILQSTLSDLEIVDTEGRVVGFFRPEISLQKLEATADWPSDEEIEAELNSGRPTFTTEQVLARLRSLG